MRVILDNFSDWSGDVSTKWKPPEGFFTQSAKKIAEGIYKKKGKNRASAISCINFYINRAGKNLSSSDRERLLTAKELLKKLYDSNT